MRLVRETYLEQIRPYYDSDIIKVITGVRRAGKSMLLDMIKDELIENGVAEDKIIYLKEHGEIIDYIDKPCIMYNFDHHHDIYYQEESKEECHKMIEFNTKEYKLLESCWVYYLFISGYITKYKCFVNYNTHISTDVLQYGFEFYLNYYDEFNPYKQDLYNVNYDKVFVILSPDYTEDDAIKAVLELIGLDDKFER